MITPTKIMTTEERKEFRKQVGKHLQELRKAAGYGSAASFAEEIGFNVNTYTQYEQGITGFNYEQAWIMADALHCSIDALGGRESPVKYADPAQERMNRQYAEMNADGKSQAAQAVENAHANLRNAKATWTPRVLRGGCRK